MKKLNILAAALLSSIALSACSVDSPERDNFDYSFLEEGDVDLEPQAADLPLSATPVDAAIEIDFRDSLGGFELPKEVELVSIVIDSVEVYRDEGHGQGYWKVVNTRPMELELTELTGGRVEKIASGPIGDGEFSGVRLHIPKVRALTEDGAVEVVLPGEYLMLDGEFETVDLETTELTINFGGLRTFERHKGAYIMDPNVTVEVEMHD
ncbi:MAG: DUF4382 domain-containing protein [Myxococcota bacterium]